MMNKNEDIIGSVLMHNATQVEMTDLTSNIIVLNVYIDIMQFESIVI